uniref:HMG box domain-containing protein n=1 Tax=Panagrellus redivivus TaxID=6233 RepID=A0A7E4VKF3_PANRE
MEALLARLYDISANVDLTHVQQNHRVFQLLKRGFAQAASLNDEARELIQVAFGTSAPPTPQKFRSQFQQSMQRIDPFLAPVKLDFDESIDLFVSPAVIPVTRTPIHTVHRNPPVTPHRIPPATAPRNQKADLQKAEQRRLKNLTEKAERVRRDREDREARVRLRRLQLESKKKSAVRGRNVFRNNDYVVYGDTTPVRPFKKVWENKPPVPRPITVPSERQSVTPVMYQSPSPENPSVAEAEFLADQLSTPNTVAREVPIVSRNTPTTDIPDEFFIVPEDNSADAEEQQLAEQDTDPGHSDSLTQLPSEHPEPPIQDSILFLQSEILFDVSAQKPVPIDNDTYLTPTVGKVETDETCHGLDSGDDEKENNPKMEAESVQSRPPTPDIILEETKSIVNWPAQPLISASPPKKCRQPSSLLEQIQFTVQSPEVCRDVHSDTVFDDDAIVAANIGEKFDDNKEKEGEIVDSNEVKCSKIEASSFETVAYVVPEDPEIEAVMASPVEAVDSTQDSTVSAPSQNTVSTDSTAVVADQTEDKHTKAMNLSFYDDDYDFVENVPPIKTGKRSKRMAEDNPPVTIADPKPKAPKKKPRDPLLPKRPTNAYLYWSKAHRADYAKPGMTGHEVTRAAAQGWKELIDKQVWQDMAAADKKRYDEEMVQNNPIV